MPKLKPDHISPTPEEDAAIAAGIAADPDTAELNDGFFQTATRGRPPLPDKDRKRRVTMYLDPDVLDRLKAEGRGWQTRANAILRRATMGR